MHIIYVHLTGPSPFTWVICSPQTHGLRYGPGQLPGPLQCLEVASLPSDVAEAPASGCLEASV